MSSISFGEQFLLTSKEYVDSKHYWLNKLGSFPFGEIGRLAVVNPDGNEFRQSSFMLDKDLAERVLAVCKNNDLSVYLYLTTACCMLIQQYTGCEPVSLGVPVFSAAFNPIQETRNGLLPVTVAVPDGTPFKELLLRVRETVLDAAKNQHYPLEKIYSELNLGPADVLFDTAIYCPSLQKEYAPEELGLPLVIRLDLPADGMGLTFFASKEVLFSEISFFRHLQMVLRYCTEKVLTPAGGIALMDDTLFRKRMWELSFDDNMSKGGNFSLVGWLRERWEQGGGEPAIRYRGTTLSYEQLGRMVRRVSACLYEQMGLRRGDRVMVCCARSEKLVAVILALLDSGLVYVPADSGFPAGRLSVLLQDADPDCVIADDLHGEWFTRQGCLVADVALLCHWDGELLSCQPLPGADETAYIMYTSGSTGTPRGVMVSHANIDHLFGRVYERYGGQNITLPFTAAHSFDISLFQLLLPLLSGGSAEVVDRQQLEDLDALMDILAGANSIDAVPGVYRLWLTYIEERGLESKMTHIRQLFIGGDLIGEGLLHRLARVFCNAGITVLYGPTEATIFCTLMSYPAGQAGPHADGRLLGRPLSSTPIYILGPNGSLLPPGLEGEIAIGGDSVTQGYRNQPEETHKKFHADLFQQQWTGQPVCGRLYRTGDRGCWTPEGLLLFRGRKDNQVKVRGNRIELEEVARRLRELPGIGEAIVLVAPSASGDSSLVAYYTGEARQRQELTDHLGQYFAMAVLPAWYRQLPAFPLSENGKIDKGRLQWLAQQQSPDEQQYKEGPRNEAERRLTTIWELLLNREGIGIHDNFFELGGHSLLAMRLAAVVRKTFGKRLSVKTLFDNPTIALLAEQMEVPGLQPELPAITATLRGPADRMPLSFAQERLWFIDRLQGSVQYHMPWVFRLDGKLRPEHLGEAVEALVERHEVLRTILVEQDGIAEQRILQVGSQQGPALPAEQTTLLPQPLLRMLDPRAASQPLPVLIEQEVNRPFRLDREPPIRVSLLPIGEQQWLLIAVIHHIAFDAWSLPILVQELAELYRSACQHRPHTLAPLPIQYADYAVWQRQYLQGDAFDQKLAYWKQQLQGWERLALPTDHPRRAEAGIRGGIVRGQLDKAATGALARLSQQEGATLFMTLLTVFKILLYRYSGQQDILVGSPVAGREQQEVEGLIGFFVNTLVLRSQIRPNASLRELLQQEKQITLAAYEHQDVPFEKIVETLGVQRDRSRQPMIDVLFALLNAPASASLGLHDVVLKTEDNYKSTADFDISLDINRSEEGLQLVITYSRDLYEPDTMQRMLNHYIILLGEAAREGMLKQPVSRWTMLEEPERQQLLNWANDPLKGAAYAGECILHLVERFAIDQPDATALVDKYQQLNYAQLDKLTNRVAHWLRQHDVREESLVPVCLDRSADMVIAILGILKTGAAYVPIDPASPPERIAYIVADTGASLLLTASGIIRGWSPDVGLLLLDEQGDMIGQQPATPPDVSIRGNQLAYVIYTSGSTGEPKGVMIEHRSLMASIRSRNDYYPHIRSMLLIPSFSFDSSVAVIFGTLCTGGRLSIASDLQLKDTRQMEQLLGNIDAILCVPSYYRFLLEEGLVDASSLDTVIVAGEAVSTELIAKHFRETPDIAIYNEYGPTEGTVWATVAKLSATNDRVTIGKPIASVCVYLLDAEMNLVPQGVTGEICLGGQQVARGYRNQPVLTDERFIADLFTDQQGGRLYRTGDLARWLPDGNIQYLGRCDNQVKIRGYRIELGEIESVLAEMDGVTAAAVVAVGDPTGGTRLAAFVTGPVRVEDVLEKMRHYLPEYMMPRHLDILQEMPLTPNGKIDRQNLTSKALGTSAEQGAAYAPPRNEVERALVAVWQELLGAERIGINDNFFELGGDSIIAIQMISRLKRYGYSLQPKDLFQHQTVNRLGSAGVIEQDFSASVARDQGMLEGVCGLLPIQEWFFEGMEKGVSHYNQSVLLQLDKSVTLPTLSAAVTILMQHHDALRLHFRQQEDHWEQYYGTDQSQVEEYPAEYGNWREEMETYSNRLQTGLDIGKGRTMRVCLFHTPADEPQNRLLLVIHHLLVDGISWRILIDDLELLLRSGVERVDLGRKTSSYREYHEALLKYGKGPAGSDQREYWSNVLSHYHQIPTDHEPETCFLPGNNRNETFSLEEEQTRQLLQDVPSVFHTEINDILLAALARTLGEWSGFDNVTIGLEGHGREDLGQRIDISRTVGWFTSIFPVLLSASAEDEITDVVKQTKEQLRLIQDKGIGFGVLKYLLREESLQGGQGYDIVFNYLGQVDNVVGRERWLSSAPESSGNTVGAEFQRQPKLEINSVISGGKLTVDWRYDKGRYDEATIRQLAKTYINNLRKIITACAEAGKWGNYHTPSDFGLGREITCLQLDAFMDEEINGISRRQQIERMYRLSGLQEGMLFHALYHTGIGSYVQQIVFDMGELDEEKFAATWAHLLLNHSILRTGFYADIFKIPVQCVFRNATVPITKIDLSEMGDEERAIRLSKIVSEDRIRGFDLKKAPLMRVQLAGLGHGRYKIIWTSHHMILDGWSQPILTQEFLETYEQLVKGEALSYREEDRYEDYIRYLAAADKNEQKAYWQNYLSGMEGDSLLPFVTSVTGRTKGAGEFSDEAMQLDSGLATAIGTFAQKQRITINTIMQGVWAYLVSVYTHKNGTAFGVTVSGRPEDMPAIEERVGLYINTLPFYSTVRYGMSAEAWLREIQQEQILSRQYQFASLTEIQEWVGWRGDLFDSIMVFENYPVSDVIASGDWDLEIGRVEVNENSNYPLSILIGSGRDINFRFRYNTSLLDKYYIQMIMDHFRQVLEQLAGKPDCLVQDLVLTPPARQQTWLKELAAIGTLSPMEKTVLDLIEQQVAQTPAATAVFFEEQELSYGELEERANRLGNFLRSKGVREETPVGICLERSPEMIVSMLGILKAGGAYVPLDPAWPHDRIGNILENAGIEIVLTSSTLASLFREIDGIEQVLRLDADWKVKIATRSEKRPVRKTGAGNLAYILFTSGSTGSPRGVLIEHGSLANYILHQAKLFGIRADDRIVQFSNYCFDASVEQIFLALTTGASLVLFSEGIQLSQRSFEDLLVRYGVTHLHATPSFIDTLEVGFYGGLRRVVAGGEPCKKALAERWNGLVGFYNKYGPTEATISVLIFHASPTGPVFPGDFLPLTIPVDNTRVVLLGRNGTPVPMGAPGEICIGGIQLARGYLNQPEATAERFGQLTLPSGESVRIYRSGDLGRWLPDGSLEYLGRLDDQVKIRGYRVEPGEIRSVLERMQGISQAVVLAVSDSSDSGRLIVFVTGDPQVDREAMLDHLRRCLPEYMIPETIIMLDTIPLTSNGKTDRRALLGMDTGPRGYHPPRNATEEKMAAIWGNLLAIERVGIFDNFFELGGHSLLAMRVVSAIRSEFGVEVQVAQLFQLPTIESLVHFLTEQQQSKEAGKDDLQN